MAARLDYSATARCARHGLLLARASGCPLCASEAAAPASAPKRLLLGICLAAAAIVLLRIGYTRWTPAAEPARAQVAARSGRLSQTQTNASELARDAMIGWTRASLSTTAHATAGEAVSRDSERNASETAIEDLHLGESWLPPRAAAAVTRPPDPPRASVDPEPVSANDGE